MVLSRGKYTVLWPEYFDIRRSKNEGRMVPREIAMENPTIDELAKAVGSLGYAHTVENDAAFPKHWWDAKGRVLVERKIRNRNS